MKRITLLSLRLLFLTMSIAMAILTARGLWFVLFVGLGSIATAFYVFLQLMRLSPGNPIGKLLLRTGDR